MFEPAYPGAARKQKKKQDKNQTRKQTPLISLEEGR
jgi:hypothetical protein